MSRMTTTEEKNFTFLIKKKLSFKFYLKYIVRHIFLLDVWNKMLSSSQDAKTTSPQKLAPMIAPHYKLRHGSVYF